MRKGVKPLFESHPHLIYEWSDKNTIDPYTISKGSHKKVHWKCRKGHEYMSVVYSKTSRKTSGCPYCSGRKVIPGVSDLGTTHPNLRGIWDENRNSIGMSEVSHASPRRVWWICGKKHRWESDINSVANLGNRCPYCSGRLPIVGETDLPTTRPDLMREWDFERNTISPTDIKKGSGKKVWWMCPNGHSWKSSVNNRSTGYGCPKCSNTISTPQYILFWSLTSLPIRDLELEFCIDTHEKSLKEGLKWTYDISFILGTKRYLVEFDGAYYHSTEYSLDKDTRKTLYALRTGHSVIRVRGRKEGVPNRVLEIDDDDLLVVDYPESRTPRGEHDFTEVIKSVYDFLNKKEGSVN